MLSGCSPITQCRQSAVPLVFDMVVVTVVLLPQVTPPLNGTQPAAQRSAEQASSSTAVQPQRNDGEGAVANSGTPARHPALSARTARDDTGDGAAQSEQEELRGSAERCRRLWEEDEWVELRPRWPLTNRVHARAQEAIAGRPTPQGLKRKRLHRSLTELTAEALAARTHADEMMTLPTVASLVR